MVEKILILDFGSQFTQLIARRIRELGVYCEIVPADSQNLHKDASVKGLILSGGPHSVFDAGSPQASLDILGWGIPVLGICYGMQWLAHALDGKVESASFREYGFALVDITAKDSPLLRKLKGTQLQTWMSHGDEVRTLPSGFRASAVSHSGGFAAMEHLEKRIFALQFHPEVTHTDQGREFFSAFVDICQLKGDWNLGDFAHSKQEEIRKQVQVGQQVICALSGGVDSTVAATMVHRAIGDRLHCFYIESGLQRQDEAAEVMASFAGSGLKVECIDAQKEFLGVLAGITDPEEKRKRIGRTFIEIFEREAKKIPGVEFLVQGTLYPDVIESKPPPGRGGFSATIKSHHNVGGLPERMHLKLIEPLRELFKDEVRKIGREIGVAPAILGRHPFPGPGLAVRCLGEVNETRLKVLRAADKIFIQEMRAAGLYEKIWQAGVVLLPVGTVGVMGDGRTYESVAALRAVVSEDGMTADWFRFPWEFLAKVSSRIVNEVRGINRVVYDISTKPPSTIEWE